MKLKNDAQSIFVNLLEYLFVIILVLNCNTIWTSYEETALNRILKVLLVAVVALYIIAKNSISRNDLAKILLAGCLCVVYFLVYALIVNYNVSSFLYFVINVFCLYVFIRFAEKREADCPKTQNRRSNSTTYGAPDESGRLYLVSEETDKRVFGRSGGGVLKSSTNMRISLFSLR